MRDKKLTFKDAIAFYLNKHKAGDKIVKDWLKTSASNEEIFEKTVDRLFEAQKKKNEQLNYE